MTRAARRQGARAGLAVAGFALAAALLATLDFRRQRLVARYEQAVEAQALALARGDPAPSGLDLLDKNLPPRAQLYRALLLARRAANAADPARRDALVDVATDALARAQRARPGWGEALVVKAFICSLEEGEPGGRTAVTLAESYRHVPFLRDGGAWRARTGLTLWDRLPAAPRARVVEEAVWLGRLAPEVRDGLFDAARASGGYRAFAARWIESRAGDADVRTAANRAAP